jgi:hypothetical protein
MSYPRSWFKNRTLEVVVVHVHLLQQRVIGSRALRERARDLEEPFVRAKLVVGAQRACTLIAVNCRSRYECELERRHAALGLP